jgi:hypothetical protein
MSKPRVDITSGVEIDRPLVEVWAVISDFARNTEWQGGMKACSWITEPPIAVGSRYDQEAGFLGRTVRTTFEFDESGDDRRSRGRSTGTTPG